jgi:hypothetical protein
MAEMRVIKTSKAALYYLPAFFSLNSTYKMGIKSMLIPIESL